MVLQLQTSLRPGEKIYIYNHGLPLTVVLLEPTMTQLPSVSELMIGTKVPSTTSPRAASIPSEKRSQVSISPTIPRIPYSYSMNKPEQETALSNSPPHSIPPSFYSHPPGVRRLTEPHILPRSTVPYRHPSYLVPASQLQVDYFNGHQHYMLQLRGSPLSRDGSVADDRDALPELVPLPLIPDLHTQYRQGYDVPPGPMAQPHMMQQPMLQPPPQAGPIQMTPPMNMGPNEQMMPVAYFPMMQMPPHVMQHMGPQQMMYEENNALMNKRRIIKRRTRTGCLTCRKRRIKCDERKPSCFNCERSKKVCMGYENLKVNKKKSEEDEEEEEEKVLNIYSLMK